MNFDGQTIQFFAQDGEMHLATDIDLIIDRVALLTAVGVGEYNLPNAVTSIRRVTWKGYKLDPYSGKELVESGSALGTVTAGKPRYYIYSDIGFRRIKLFPAPNEILTVPGTSLWQEAAIKSSLIVEFVSVPDYTTTDKRIPPDHRRIYVKDWVSMRCYQREGPGMDQLAANYYMMKFKQGTEECKYSKNQLFDCIHHENIPYMYHWTKPGRPVLPPNFGVSIR